MGTTPSRCYAEILNLFFGGGNEKSIGLSKGKYLCLCAGKRPQTSCVVKSPTNLCRQTLSSALLQHCGPSNAAGPCTACKVPNGGAAAATLTARPRGSHIAGCWSAGDWGRYEVGRKSGQGDGWEERNKRCKGDGGRGGGEK